MCPEEQRPVDGPDAERATSASEIDAERLLELTYTELRRMAAEYLERERTGHTLQPTALVHEAYLRLSEQKRVEWRNRAHFLGVAAQSMRRVLVDHARARRADKRGGDRGRVSLEHSDALEAASECPEDLVAVDAALERLRAVSQRAARIVELRFFGGASCEAAAEVLGLSDATVERDWRFARAWLARELRRADE